MTEAMQAYDKLISYAKGGREYRYDEVFTVEEWTVVDGAAIIATGHDIERTIQVIDTAPGNTVTGTAALRILYRIDGDEPTLFIRIKLSWVTSDGGKHESFAAYDLSRTVAESLPFTLAAYPEVTDGDQSFDDIESALSAVFDIMNTMSASGAEWRQTYPGSDSMFSEIDEEDDIQEEDGYHARAVIAAQEAEPDLLCMLSDSELGQASGDELVRILDWISTHHAAKLAG